MQEQQQLIETGKHVGDALSMTTVGAVMLGWLPTLTALVSLVWVIMRIYESYLNIMEKRSNASKPKNKSKKKKG